VRHSSKLHPVPASEPPPAFDNLELSFAPEQLPLIEPGVHDVVVLGCKKAVKFDREILAFTFKVVSQGPWFECLIPTYINLPPAGRGRTVLPRSKLATWLRVIHAFDPSLNLTRLNVRLFSLFQFRAEISTVVVDRNQQPLPANAQYSKIDRLIEVVGKVTA